jgi:predicted Rossmann fold nucleotide-binding protein DprA/Smf involved in DNA uptake
MSLPRRSFILTLAMMPGVGGRSVVRILARNDLLSRTPEEFFQLSNEAYREEYRLTAKVAEYLVEHRDTLIAEVAPFEKRLEALGVRWTVVTDAGYPELLERFDPDPPAILFLYGNTKLLEAKTFAVLSSRNSSRTALDTIDQLTEEGVLNREVIVTGHDKPEYQRSAVVPLRWGAPRILCLDRGLFQVLGEDLRNEAFRMARLWRYEFDPTTDLVISPFRPEASFKGINNQVRDRLVAGLSQRIDFVNVAHGGNMEKLAKFALKDGRTVRMLDPSMEWLRMGVLAI